MSTSKLQRAFSKALSFHFGGYTIRENSRPDWCLSDDMNRLELDFYLPELDVAIEIQGIQHYQYSPFFHESYAAFRAQVQRDKAKKSRCIEYGVHLIEVDDDQSFAEAIDTLKTIARRKVTTTNIKPDEAINLEKQLVAIDRKLIALWQERWAGTWAKITASIGGQKIKLGKLTEDYDVEILQCIDPKIAKSVSNHMLKLSVWVNARKRDRANAKHFNVPFKGWKE
jgi:hypothetical protein